MTDNLNDSLLADLLRRVHILEVSPPAGYTAVSRGAFRIVSNEGLLVEGSAKVAGWLVVTGTANITGQLVGSGVFDWAGPCYLKGNTTISGSLTISNTLNVTGAATFGNSVDVLNRLSLGPSGYIEAGTVRIDRLGAHGGRVASTGSVLALGALSSVIIDAAYLVASAGSFTDLSAVGAIDANIKNFKIPHPTKLDHWLRHGSTESPVSGVEYWGEETLPETGELTVELPHYFEALTKQENRAVMVTARGFVADWGDIENGSFTVTGTPGGRFSWLVKAERQGADFLLEEPVFGPLRLEEQ